MKASLTGIRVLECGVWIQGPLATTMLGDLGAEVIKIEDRVAGDPSRGAMRLSGVSATQSARNPVFGAFNRNKKSITIDLTKEAGKEIFYKLVGKSDVFVQNIGPGFAKRLGLDYQTLYKYNPMLIYVSASGYGPKGPDRDTPAVDYLVVGRSGMMTVIGEAGTPPLYYGGAALADHIAAMMTAYSVLAALIARDKLGMGQEVNTSILGTLAAVQAGNLEMVLATGQSLPRIKRTKPVNPIYNHYRCADDKWFVLGLLDADRRWPGFCRVMGIPELEKDPKFETMEARTQNSEELVSILDKLFATKPRDEWLRVLESGRLRCSPVNTILDFSQDPQVLANDYIVDYDHPALGQIKTLGFPFGMSQTPLTIRLPTPEFGQHTEEVLTDILGYSWEDISKLKEREVI